MEDLYLTQLVPLTKKEEALRAELESKVFAVVRQSYIDLGETLSEIKERKLYKSTHHTFADYSREVLDMARQSAYQYIQAYGVVQNLSAIADKIEEGKVNNCSQNQPQLPLPIIPQNEGQARALVGLTPEEQREAWLNALSTAPDGKVTAAHIRKTVRELKGADTQKTIEKTKRLKKENSARISGQFQDAFNNFLIAVQEEINSNWKTTDRLTVVQHLDSIRGAISENGNHRIPEPGYAIEASNTEKLIAAGFTIYRADTIRLIIEKLVRNSEWVVVEVYQEKETLTKAFDVLMQDLNNLRG